MNNKKKLKIVKIVEAKHNTEWSPLILIAVFVWYE